MGKLTIQHRTATKRRFFEPLAPGIDLEMVLVPGGSFLMGSPDDEPKRDKDESPQHLVTVPTFFMGCYPVTQAQWRVVANWESIQQNLDPSPSHFRGEQRPVEQISWYDAAEFCDRLAQRTQRSYRLPSEAEWEYACRAGTQTPFYFGETVSPNLANYDGNFMYGQSPSQRQITESNVRIISFSEKKMTQPQSQKRVDSQKEYRAETTTVANFNAPNAYGLCDMHGNVFEWCADHWHENYEGAPNDGSIWSSSQESADRVIRGGSWYSSPGLCRSASRLQSSPGHRSLNNGFRVVCDRS